VANGSWLTHHQTLRLPKTIEFDLRTAGAPVGHSCAGYPELCTFAFVAGGYENPSDPRRSLMEPLDDSRCRRGSLFCPGSVAAIAAARSSGAFTWLLVPPRGGAPTWAKEAWSLRPIDSGVPTFCVISTNATISGVGPTPMCGPEPETLDGSRPQVTEESHGRQLPHALALRLRPIAAANAAPAAPQTSRRR